MTEVKMVYGDVRAQIDDLESKASALQPAAPEPISGNVLDVADKLNELMKRLEQVLTRYQTVLQENIRTTNGSVDFMEETDEKISTAIHGSGPQPMR